MIIAIGLGAKKVIHRKATQKEEAAWEAGYADGLQGRRLPNYVHPQTEWIYLMAYKAGREGAKK